MSPIFTESTVEEAALDWSAAPGYTVGPKLISGKIRIKDGEKLVESTS